MKLALVLASVFAGCSMAPVAPASPSQAGALGLPAVQSALEFPPGAKEVTLGWLVDQLGRLTVQELTLSPQLRNELDQSIEPLEIVTPVPAVEVYAYVEGMLAQRAMFLAPVKGGARPVLGVYGGSVVSGSTLAGAKPVRVASDQLDALEDHPALYCQTVLEFQNIDSRQLQTQLRQITVDSSGIHQVVPCGERSLLLQGTGSRLSGLSRTLRDIDRAAAARPTPAPPEAPPPKER